MGCASSHAAASGDESLIILSLSEITPADLQSYSFHQKRLADGTATPHVSTPTSPSKFGADPDADRYRANQDFGHDSQQSGLHDMPLIRPELLPDVGEGGAELKGVPPRVQPRKERFTSATDSTPNSEQNGLTNFLSALAQTFIKGEDPNDWQPAAKRIAAVASRPGRTQQEQPLPRHIPRDRVHSLVDFAGFPSDDRRLEA
eukprot:CAMPEP_0115850690 /NCGR_PEP_ID=MMETSP0287-20121206/12097_1 /TAXON_ID=412157 /ORGANISM="Chrysochromulina rotalis, Strain UIO044" /LENGTH=201 /DNA_ID=CAMNT_0003304701 /DNA_START=74 /DNA_END=679 /DNA_ORIENTATION=-